MTTKPRLEVVLKRLAAALDELEAAAGRRIRSDADKTDCSEELAVMQDDRSRLAVELDGALARAKALASANAEVSRRLEKASESIRAVLAPDSERD